MEIKISPASTKEEVVVWLKSQTLYAQYAELFSQYNGTVMLRFTETQLEKMMGRVGDAYALYNELHPSGSKEGPTQVRSYSPMFREINSNIEDIKAKLKGLNLGTPTSFAKRYDMLNKRLDVEMWFTKSNVHTLSEFANPPQAGAKEKKTVQPWWTGVIKSLSANPSRIKLVDVHARTTIGDLMPDTLGYISEKPNCPFYIAIIGENKGRREPGAPEIFTNEEKGQLAAYFDTLLSMYQQHRKEITGYLSDGNIIQFFRYSSSVKNGLMLEESTVMYLSGEGGRYLLGLLNMEPTDIGMPITEVKIDNSISVHVDEFLGSGGSSVVFRGTIVEDSLMTSNKVVLKYFRPSREYMLDIEAKNLDLVQQLQPLVPRVVAKALNAPILIMSPVGKPFCFHHKDYTNFKNIKASRKHFIELITLLEKVHDLKFVHRDISLNNFFENDKNVLLNDWNCATQIDVPTTFSGCLQNAHNEVLYKIKTQGRNAEYYPHATDDLEMWVKCLFSRVATEYIIIYGETSVEKLLNFWDNAFQAIFWKEMINLAKKRDYKKLAEQVEYILS